MGIDILPLDLLGFAATAFSVCMWIPQARTTWKSRNDAIRLAGISETTQWLMMIGYLLWGFFGVLSESLWVAAPSLVSIPLALGTIIIVHRGRRLPLTRSVPIISTTEETPLDDTTVSIPIISTDAALDGESSLSPTTGAVPILSTVDDPAPMTGAVPVLFTGAVSVSTTDATAVVAEAVAEPAQSREFSTTGPIPVLA